jgi:predicted ATP-grasp superfamily ATP-dependent carboligase
MPNTKSNKIIKVLLTDGQYKHTLAALRCLARSDYQVDVIGSSKCLTYWSKYLSRISYKKDDFCEEGFEQFLNFLRHEKYDVILPIGAKSIELISRYKSEVEKHCLIPLTDNAKINICLNKQKTYLFANQLGINIPNTWYISSEKDLQNHIQDFRFPVVVKGNDEILKDIPMYASNQSDLLDILNVWGKNIPINKNVFCLVQEYIKGVGCGFFALYQEGQLKRIFMHKRIRETPPSGGASCCAISIFEEDLFEAGKKLLDALVWHGVAMVEFRRELDTGRLYLMEINPKFWGSLDLAIASGVNFPKLAVDMVMGQNIEYSNSYRVGLRYHWPLDSGELDHLMKNPKAFFPVILDCLNPKTKSNLWIRDPLPGIYSLYGQGRSIAARIANRRA